MIDDLDGVEYMLRYCSLWYRDGGSIYPANDKSLLNIELHLSSHVFVKGHNDRSKMDLDAQDCCGDVDDEGG